MSTKVEDMSETETVLDLALTLFNMPDIVPEMTDEDAVRCTTAAFEMLVQYLRKLRTGAAPVLTLETKEILARIEAREFELVKH